MRWGRLCMLRKQLANPEVRLALYTLRGEDLYVTLKSIGLSGNNAGWFAYNCNPEIAAAIEKRLERMYKHRDAKLRDTAA